MVPLLLGWILVVLAACDNPPGSPYVVELPFSPATATLPDSSPAPQSVAVPDPTLSQPVPSTEKPVPPPEQSVAPSEGVPEPVLAPTRAALPSSEPALRPGDPVRGRALLIDNGTPDAPYMSCGVPERLVRLAGLDRDWPSKPKIPERRDADLPYDVNYVMGSSGVRLLATNCLLCHASVLKGRLVIGLPDVSRDFTQPDTLSGLPGLIVRAAARTLLNADEQRELGRMLRVVDVVSTYPRPDTVGMNPADGLFGALTTHRDPDTLVWRSAADPAAGPVPKRIIFTDVPALWNTHRRENLFQTGFGQGDHARVMMTSSLLCLEDSAEAERIDAYFPDVQAFIHTLRAPRYDDFAPAPFDRDGAERGRAHYVERCQRCHGGKDGEGDRPLPFVALEEVGTDPVYAQVTLAGNRSIPEAQTVDYFFDFFNRSWYGQFGAKARLVRPERPGYVPPPLDGVWATAPYFHNGSVPTLEAVLDPSLRPSVFKRSFDPDEYDFVHVGWPYLTLAEKAKDAAVYDTTRLGASNAGHEYGSELSPGARADLLEYLKSL